MLTCSRCHNAVDETKQTSCPVCSAPLTVTPPAANYRTSLTGEVIEVPATASSAVTAQIPTSQTAVTGGPPSPFGAPIAYVPRAAAPAGYSTAPEILPQERTVMRAGVAIGIVLLLVFGIGGFALYSRYSNAQAAFNKATHLHLDTPEAAAREMVEAFRDENWGRIYWICEFADLKNKNVKEGLEAGRGFRKGWESAAANSPDGANKMSDMLKSITDIKIGAPEGKGDHVRVSVSAMMDYGGTRALRQGSLPLINCEDGKWRVDMSTVSIMHPSAGDGQTFMRVLTDMLGLTTAATPAQSPDRKANFPRGQAGNNNAPVSNQMQAAPPINNNPPYSPPPGSETQYAPPQPPAFSGDNRGGGQSGAPVGSPPTNTPAPTESAPPAPAGSLPPVEPSPSGEAAPPAPTSQGN